MEIRLKMTENKSAKKKKGPKAHSFRFVQDVNTDIQMRITGPQRFWEMRRFG